MPNKLKEIQSAPRPKPSLKIKLAGAALLGALSVSCAPKAPPKIVMPTMHITVSVPKPKAEKPRNLKWEKFSEKYSLNKKEEALIESAFILEQEKTGLWPSQVFETLIENSTIRRFYLQKACRLIHSTLNRTEAPLSTKTALGTLEYLFKGPKVGSAELDIMINLVEGGPELGQEELRTLHNAASIFRSDAYSPEFLIQMQHFLNDGGIFGSSVSRDKKLLILDSFSGLARHKSGHAEFFEVINKTLEVFSERAKELATEQEKENRKFFSGAAFPGGIHPFARYLGPTKRDAALVFLSAFRNPNVSQKMIEDISFGLKTIINSSSAGNSTSKSALAHLGTLCSLDFFDSGASGAMRKYFKKYSSSYGDLEDFLNSALIISIGRNFRYSYNSYLFVGMLSELEEVFSLLKKQDADSKLPTAARILANNQYYPQLLETLKTLIKSSGRTTYYAIDSLSALSESKSISPKLLLDFSQISRKFSSIGSKKKKEYAFSDLEEIIRHSKNPSASLANLSFALGEKCIRLKPTLSLFSVLAKNGELVDEPSFVQKFERAKELAKESGANYKDPEVCINFAYAIETIGAQKAARLYKNFGIEYFARYSKEFLEGILNSGNSQYRSLAPVAFTIYNKDDHNGAFYQNRNVLSELLKTHKAIAIEVSSFWQIPKKMEETLQREQLFYGNMLPMGRHKISALIIGGHGNPGGISFGRYGDSGYLSSSDIGIFKRLRKYFVGSPAVILISCSTGKSERAIGGRISRILGARLFAPKKDGNIGSIKVGPKGEILDVGYNVPSNEFESGKIKREDEE